MSYKGAMDNGSHRVKSGDKAYQEEKRMGKMPMAEHRDGHKNNGRARDDRYQRHYGNQQVGGEHGQRQRLPNQGRMSGQHHRSGRHAAKEKDHDREEGQCSDVRRPVTAVNLEQQSDLGEVQSGPMARKALFQEKIGDGQQGMETSGGEEEAVVLPSDSTMEVVVAPMVGNDKPTSGGEVLMDESNGKAELEGEDGDIVGENKHEDQIIMLPDGEMVALEDQETGLEIMESGEVEAVVRAPARKKVGKGSQVLQVVSSKKRLVQTLLSSRKRGGNKNNVQFGDGLYPAKPRKEPGHKGDQVPPKLDNK